MSWSFSLGIYFRDSGSHGIPGDNDCSGPRILIAVGFRQHNPVSENAFYRSVEIYSVVALGRPDVSDSHTLDFRIDGQLRVRQELDVRGNTPKNNGEPEYTWNYVHLSETDHSRRTGPIHPISSIDLCQPGFERIGRISRFDLVSARIVGDRGPIKVSLMNRYIHLTEPMFSHLFEECYKLFFVSIYEV